MDSSPSGSSVLGISRARILEWLAISFSRGSSRLMDETHVSCLAGGFFTTEPPEKAFSSLVNNKASKHSPRQVRQTFSRQTQPCLDSCRPHNRTLPQTPGWRPTFTPFLLEKEMATYSSTLAWKISWTEEPKWATVHGVAKSQTRLSDFTHSLTIHIMDHFEETHFS